MDKPSQQKSEEQQIKEYKDSSLLKRLLSCSHPYWKKMMLAIILAGLVIVATIAQPYIVKIVIDDRSNGLYKPMIAVDANMSEHTNAQLKADGWRPEQPATFHGQAYMRINNRQQAQTLPEDSSQHQIITLDGQTLLVSAWVSSIQDASVAQVNDGWQVQADDQTYSAVALDDEAIRAFRQQDYQGFLVLGIIFLLIIIAAAFLQFFQQRLC